MTTTADEYAKAMSVIDDLAKEYQGWVQGDLKKLQDGYEAALLADANNRVQIMQYVVFRTAHDMKGQGAMFKYDLVTDIGNHLCRYIEKQEAFDALQMAAVKAHIDALAEVVNHHLTGDGGARGQELKQQTEAL